MSVDDLSESIRESQESFRKMTILYKVLDVLVPLTAILFVIPGIIVGCALLPYNIRCDYGMDQQMCLSRCECVWCTQTVSNYTYQACNHAKYGCRRGTTVRSQSDGCDLDFHRFDLGFPLILAGVILGTLVIYYIVCRTIQKRTKITRLAITGDSHVTVI